MVTMDLNIGFQGLALIQGQIYDPGISHFGEPLQLNQNREISYRDF